MIKAHYGFIVPILVVIFARTAIFAYLYFQEISGMSKEVTKGDLMLTLILTGIAAAYIFFLLIAVESLYKGFFHAF